MALACDIHTSEMATAWCSQCSQLLCDGCALYHSQAKISKDHETVTIDNYAKLPCFVKSLRSNCGEHNNKSDFYCPVHEVLCCVSCVQDVHKMCGVNSIQSQAENIKRSETMAELESSLRDLSSNIEDILQDRESNIVNIENQKLSLLKHVSDLKTTVMNHIEELEREVKEDLSDVVRKEKVRQDKLVSELKEKQTVVRQIRNDIENIKQNASDIDTFLALQRLSADVITDRTYLNQIMNDTSLFHTEITFEKSDSIQSLLSTIRTLGKFVIISKPRTFQITEGKVKQAQLFVTDCKSDKSLQQDDEIIDPMPKQSEITDNETNLKHEIEKWNENKSNEQELISDDPNKDDMGDICQSLEVDENNCTSDLNQESKLDCSVVHQRNMKFPFQTKQLSAVKMLSNDKFVFLDHNGKRVILYNRRTNYLKSVNLYSCPVDLALEPPNTIVVSLYSAKMLAFVDISSGYEIERIKTDEHCFGVDFDGTHYYVSCPRIKQVHIFDSNREDFKAISTQYSGFYLVKHDDFIVCSNHIENVIFCLSTSGSHIWNLKNNNLLEPLCLAADRVGNIFVSGRRTKCVNKISKDGSSCEVILKDIGGVSIPRAINYCVRSKQLIVCDERLDCGMLVFIH